LPRQWFRGDFEAKFRVESSDDGFYFKVSAGGTWLRRSFRLRNPESIAVTRVINDITGLCRKHSILAVAALEHKLNAHMSRAMRAPGLKIQRAQVNLHVESEDQFEVKSRIRLRARAKIDHEIKQLEIAELLSFRDMLREDPTIAYAQLLLKSPEKILDDSVTKKIKEIGEQIATYAPGAAWVRTAQLLDNSFGQLPIDAKKTIIERVCDVLMEFGMEIEARNIMQVHGTAVSAESSSASNKVFNGANGEPTLNNSHQ
jgi:hypothetical protein